MGLNQYEVADWITMESLRLLTNSLALSPYFNMEYSKDFTKEYAVGDTERIRLPHWFVPTSGMGYQPQPIIDRHTTVKLDQTANVHLEWDSIEQALRMPRGEDKVRETILKPAVRVMRQEFESRAALWAYRNTPNVVGTLGTNPASFDAIYGAAGQRLEELAGDGDDMGMFLSPAVARALRATAIAQFNPPDEISRMWKKGIIGEANGFMTYSSMSLYTHTAGVWAGTVEINTAPASGANSILVTCTIGDTFNPGDSFNIAAVYAINPATLRSTGTLRQFEVGGDVTLTATGTTITLPLVTSGSEGVIVGPGSPYQNVDALPVAGADLTLFPGTTTPSTGPKSGTQGLAITKNMAFALVSVPLANPKQAELASISRDPKSGISVSFLRMFDPIERKWINRFDSLFGFGNLYNDKCAVRALGA